MHYLDQLKKDKKLASILGSNVHTLTLKKNIPVRLMASIMSQQLSTKVAAIIFKRFVDLNHGIEPDIDQVLATPPETLRAIGLSNNKVQYILNVARFCKLHGINDEVLLHLSNEEIIALLTQIKGVGKWTVEMLLMFSLQREDVFALDDLGIQQGMVKLYKLDALDKKALKEKMIVLSNKWKPYRTYACLHIWQFKDN